MASTQLLHWAAPSATHTRTRLASRPAPAPTPTASSLLEPEVKDQVFKYFFPQFGPEVEGSLAVSRCARCCRVPVHARVCPPALGSWGCTRALERPRLPRPRPPRDPLTALCAAPAAAAAATTIAAAGDAPTPPPQVASSIFVAFVFRKLLPGEELPLLVPPLPKQIQPHMLAPPADGGAAPGVLQQPLVDAEGPDGGQACE